MELYGAEQHRIARINHGTRAYTQFIVVHTMEGTLTGTYSYFSTSSPDAVGAHFGIGAGTIRKPRVQQWADDGALVYHARGANAVSIGIELEGYASQSRMVWKLRRGQRVALAETIARLCYHHKLGEPTHKGTNKNVKGHVEIPEGGHTDPGPNFPWDLVMPIAVKRYRKWYKTP